MTSSRRASTCVLKQWCAGDDEMGRFMLRACSDELSCRLSAHLRLISQDAGRSCRSDLRAAAGSTAARSHSSLNLEWAAENGNSEESKWENAVRLPYPRIHVSTYLSTYPLFTFRWMDG